ncbi:MAG: DUF3800 domain-containing protein [bacterium]|nr:DUF3800 domain-containing protein [bacterium]
MIYIFLDESGDLGFNPSKKNSKYFVITVLATEDKRKVEKVIKKIHSSLRKKTKKLSGGILHCYKEKPATRHKLLQKLSGLNIHIMTIYLHKVKVFTHLQDEKHVLYNYVTNILLDRIMSKKLINVVANVHLIAAKRETNKFLNDNFSNYLKTQARDNHKIRLDIVIRTPSEEKGIQAVDFVSWSVFRKYEHGDAEYYKEIKNKIVEENGLFK